MGVRWTLCCHPGSAALRVVQWVDADSLLDQLVDDYRAAGRVIDMSGRVGGPVAVCPGALSRIVRNLLGGASRTGTAVRVEISAESSRLAVTVANEGAGVSLEPLRQGLSLGLSTARPLAQAMRGDLKLRSSDEGWLEGCLSLPRARPPTIRS
jgi:signal transduction histidine kinase